MIDHVIEIRPDCISAVCSGNYSDLEDLERVLSQVLDEAARANQPKILLDARAVRGEPQKLHRFFLGKWLADRCQEYQPDIQFQIACVGRYPFISREHHTETVFRNRGGQGLVTADLAEAEKWLGLGVPVGDGTVDGEPTLD